MREPTGLVRGLVGWRMAAACAIALWASLSAAEPQASLTVDLGGGVSMEFVLIRPGSSSMGSAKGEANEKPVHKVTISKPFYLGKYEVQAGLVPCGEP